MSYEFKFLQLELSRIHLYLIPASFLMEAYYNFILMTGYDFNYLYFDNFIIGYKVFYHF